MEIGNEAAQFLSWEYTNPHYFAVYVDQAPQLFNNAVVYRHLECFLLLISRENWCSDSGEMSEGDIQSRRRGVRQSTIYFMSSYLNISSCTTYMTIDIHLLWCNYRPLYTHVNTIPCVQEQKLLCALCSMQENKSHLSQESIIMWRSSLFSLLLLLSKEYLSMARSDSNPGTNHATDATAQQGVPQDGKE